MATHEQVAEHLFVSRQKISELVRRKILPTGKGVGALDIDACRKAYVEHLRGIAAGKIGEGGFDLTDERARLAKEQADAQAMKNALARGEMLDATEAERTWGEVLRGIRARMMAVPSRVRQRLGHLTAAEAAIIDREVRDALTEAAGGIGK